MDSLFHQLTKAGMELLHAQIYLLCVEHGELSISILAKKLAKPRTTLYKHIELMKQNDYLLEIKKSFGHVYQAVSFDQIIDKLLVEQRQIEQLVHDMKAVREEIFLLSKKHHHTAQVKNHQGYYAIEALYERFTHTQNGFAYFDVQVALKNLQRPVSKIATVLRNTQSFREILVDNEVGREYYNTYDTKTNHQTKFFDKKTKGAFPTDTVCCDGVLYYISYDESMFALEIHYSALVETTQTMFDLVWNSLPEVS